MTVILQPMYVAVCSKCGWESVLKMTESAAENEERTHWAQEHPDVP
jgi:hypothetical protein